MEEHVQQKSITVERVNENSNVLARVVELGDKNRKYVGFFPEAAFKRNAAEGRILVALDGGGVLHGYLLYYVARSRAVLQQLCVSEEYRSRGIGRKLVERLKAETRHLDGISLHCRRDFPAHEFWPGVGFVAFGEKRGRGKGAGVLTRYWYGHGHPDLFSECETDSRVVVVIDANIFFDLFSEGDAVESEVDGLKADWLSEHLDFAVTYELFNEIDRQEDQTIRELNRGHARCMTVIRGQDDKIRESTEKLRVMVGMAGKPSDKSDIRQLAHAIAEKTEFFLTRDESILRRAEDIQNTFGMRVIRPAELVLWIDEFVREVDYRPEKMGGSSIQVRALRADDLKRVTETFLNHGGGEKKADFDKVLHMIMADRGSGTGWVVEDGNGDMLGFVLAREGTVSELEVKLFRVKECRLRRTLARSLAMHLVRSRENVEGLGIVRVVDQRGDVIVDEALGDVGFVRQGKFRTKINVGHVGDAGTFLKKMKEEGHVGEHDIGGLNELLGRVGNKKASVAEAARAEKLLWPGRLLGAGIPTYIVPVQARWAVDLFDEELAAQRLFNADAETALAWEKVYYRGSVPRVLDAPGRILWYVSRDRDYEGSGSIRACSSLEGVTVGSAKDLYRRFRRFGVFRWRDVLKTAHGDPAGDLMAIVFGGTQLLRERVDLEKLREILDEGMGTIPPLSTAVKIPESCFKAIYDGR